jgi:hypothetical protein
MPYTLPDWGVWSDGQQEMLETKLVDLDYAKDRAHELFADDETVEVVQICPQHPEKPKHDCTEEH